MKTSMHLFLGLFLAVAISAHANIDLAGYAPYNVVQTTAPLGGTVNVDCLVANYGSSPSGSFAIRFFISKDAHIDPAVDIPTSGHLGVSSLDPNKARSFALTLSVLVTESQLAALGGPGVYHLGMVCDSQGVTGDSNPANNRNIGLGTDLDTLALTIPLPDLRGWDGRPSADSFFAVLTPEPLWGETGQVRIGVVNGSFANAGPFKVRVYLSADGTISSSDVPVMNVNFPNGLPALSYNVGVLPTLDFPLPAGNPFGNGTTNFWLGLIVDADGQIAETNESNNSNQGLAKDLAPVVILAKQPVMAVTDSAAPAGDLLVNFGPVGNDGAGGRLAEQTIWVTNTGKAPLQMTALALTGNAGFSLHQIQSNTQGLLSAGLLPMTLAANGNEVWTLTLRYDPAANGTTMAVLSLTSTDPSTPLVSVGLSGTGTPVPKLALVPPGTIPMAFGGVAQDGTGGAQVTRVIALTNAGSGPLQVQQAGVNLTTQTHFTINSVTSSIHGAVDTASAARTLTEGEVWHVALRFDPAAVGDLSAGLHVLSNDPDTPDFAVALTGTGLEPMHLHVTDSSGEPGDRSVAYAAVPADGTGKESAVAIVTFSNIGAAILTLPQNGVTLASGAHFTIGRAVSSLHGEVDLTAASKTLAPHGAESLAVTVMFDPAGAGMLADSLRIACDDPAAAVTTVALTGTGFDGPRLVIAGAVDSGEVPPLGFGPVLNDGPGGRAATLTVVSTNCGTQPLELAQNGLVISGSGFELESIVSSIRGVINPGSAVPAERSLAPGRAEEWTITVRFDPAANSLFAGALTLASNDPARPSVVISLQGQGEQPVVTLLGPATDLHVSAGSPVVFSWEDAYAAGAASLRLHLDADTDPASGLILIAEGLSEDSATNRTTWQADPARAGGPYHIYATITDGPVTRGSYAPGRLKIDAQGSFQLLSAPVTTEANYLYIYRYNGMQHQGVAQLVPGKNLLIVTSPLPGGGAATHQLTVELVESLIQKTSIVHDELHQVASITNGNGVVTSLSRDLMGNVTTRRTSTGVMTRFSHDPIGRLLSMQDDSGWTFYEWGDYREPVAIIRSSNGTKGDGDDLRLAYEYELNNLRSATVLPGGDRITSTYTPAGKLKTVTDVARGLIFEHEYHAQTGQLIRLKRSNGIDTVYEHGLMGRLTKIRHQEAADGTLIEEFDYSLDNAGKVLEVRITKPGNNIRREKYVYDDFDHIIQAIYADQVIDANDRTVLYTYGGNGRRLTKITKVNGLVTEERRYVYGNENRLMKVTDGAGAVLAEYRYDGEGNRTLKITPSKTTQYGFNDLNLLVSCSDGTTYLTFEYDGHGRRVARTCNGKRTVYVNDPLLKHYEAVQQRDEGGAVVATAVFGSSRLAVTGTETHIDLLDRIGSTQMLTDETGAMLEQMRHDIFGESPTSDAARFACAEPEPGTDLYFMRARFYDAETGCFISKDPLGIAAGLNTYLYVNADPVNRIDPSGLEDEGYLGEFILNTITDLVTGNVGGDSYYGGILPESDRDYARQVDVAAYGRMALESPKQAMEALGLKWWDAQTAAKLHDVAVNYAVKHGGAKSFMDLKHPMIQRAHWNLSVQTPYPAVKALFAGLALQGRYTIPTSEVARPSNRRFKSIPRDDDDVTLKKLDSDNYPFFPPRPPGGGAMPVPLPSTVSPATTRSDFSPITDVIRVGGVLLKESAQMSSADAQGLLGVRADPVRQQILFLTADDNIPLAGVGFDLLHAAFHSVYSAAVPPSVTLRLPISASSSWSDNGDGDAVFETGETGHVPVRYQPTWHGEDTMVDINLFVDKAGVRSTWTARLLCGPVPGVGQQGDGPFPRPMRLDFESWITPPPAGVSLTSPVWSSEAFMDAAKSSFDSYQQNTLSRFLLQNNTANNFVVYGSSAAPARIHRQFGGGLEGTFLGWLLQEMDRVLGNLANGEDEVTDSHYSSATLLVPGYQNLIERGVTSLGRIWLTPGPVTLRRGVDSATGTPVFRFDPVSVVFHFESASGPAPAGAQAFADHFAAHFDDFANLAFPCIDPDDPNGRRLIYVPIFAWFKQAAQAVALARYLRESGTPVDGWWAASSPPAFAFTPKSLPRVFDAANGYMPPTSSQSVPVPVPPVAGGVEFRDEVLDQIGMAEDTDLSLASPGGSLVFRRTYRDGATAAAGMGAGWNPTPYVMEFERPPWTDEACIMREPNGTPVWKDAQFNTHLRTGQVKVVDVRTGGWLDFTSSMSIVYAADALNSPTIVASGLTEGVSTFLPGTRQDGSTLTQLTDARKYRLDMLWGDHLIFDFRGRLLETVRDSVRQVYDYDERGRLVRISDAAGQSLVMDYDADSHLLNRVTASDGRAAGYTYRADGCLESARDELSGATVTYQYNNHRQLTGRRLPNGLSTGGRTSDLRGRSQTESDSRGNVVERQFLVAAGGTRYITQTTDPVLAGSGLQSWQEVYDELGRLIETVDATGARTTFAFEGDAREPSVVQLPIPGRPAIHIEYNSRGQPTRVQDKGNPNAVDVIASYDPVTGQMTSLKDAAGRVLTALYNALHRVERVRIQRAGQNADTVYSYYPTGSLHTVTDPLGHTILTLGRDARDRVTSVMDAEGVTITSSYDAWGRLSKYRHPSFGGDVELFFDLFDRLIELRTPTGSYLFEYDPLKGWLVRETDVLGRVTRYVRDPATGDVVNVIQESLMWGDQVTTLAYQRHGQITQVVAPDSAPVTFTYDALGRPTGSMEADVLPPGPPTALDSDRADDGQITFARDHRMTWTPPETDGGIAGFSIGRDEAPDDTVDAPGVEAVWNSVAEGDHLFHVKALGNNGLWGAAAVFHLRIAAPTGYELWRRARFTMVEVDNTQISDPDADPDLDGVVNLIEYALGQPPKSSQPLSLSLSLNAAAPRLTFNRNVEASDVILRIEGSDSMAPGTWTTLAAKAGDEPWTTTGVVTVSEVAGVVTADHIDANATGRQFLRLRVTK